LKIGGVVLAGDAEATLALLLPLFSLLDSLFPWIESFFACFKTMLK
jgi:hypothetical protein